LTAPQSMAAEKPKKSRKKWIIVIVAIVAVALVATFLVIEYLPIQNPPAAPAAPNVTIWNGIGCSGTQNCGFVPNVRTVSVGTNVTWTNSGGQTHTITTCDSSHTVSQCPANDASGLDSLDASVPAGGSYSHVFTKAGTYYYYCRPHPWMQGEIIAQ